MLSFLKDFSELPFLQNAVLAGILCSVSGGVVGTFVVLRRITYIAAAISHCILGGIAAAKYFSIVYNIAWLKPIHGALITAIAAAVVIGVVTLKVKEREDTIISALWAVGMSAGVLFAYKTPGYGEDLMNYLFGNILMVANDELVLIAILDVIVIGLIAVFYRQLTAVCFDEEFAKTRGVRVDFYYLLLLCLTALTVVLTVSVVGIVLVIALLTIPVAISCRFFDRVWKIMLSSVVIGTIFNLSGLVFSYEPNLPSGALTIAIAGAVYFAVLAAPRARTT